MKKAIIIGSNGQDGTLLYENLFKKGYSLIGLDQSVIRLHNAQWKQSIDIASARQVFDLIRSEDPDEIYYLAAYHHSAEDAPIELVELYKKSNDVHVAGLINVLDGIRKHKTSTRLFYAASSHIFKGSGTDIQNETTAIEPRCIYGITKAAGMYACRFYRSVHSVYASTGILYNHESSLRSDKFVTMKIIKAAVRIKKGLQDKLVLGDLGAESDWGYAPDYVEAFRRILMLDQPDDFIVATGIKHSVKDFVVRTFESLGLDWRKHVEENASIITKQRTSLLGDPSKLKAMTGWKPSIDFSGMIKELLANEGEKSK